MVLNNRFKTLASNNNYIMRDTQSKYRILEANSGHRPRFKRPTAGTTATSSVAALQRLGSGRGRRHRWLVATVAGILVVSAISITPTHCDDLVSLQLRGAPHSATHQPAGQHNLRHHSHSNQPTSGGGGGLEQRPRYKRNTSLEASDSRPAGDNRSDPETYKVAALATKLEHWLTCRRSADLRPSDRRSPTAECPAHYDGHLCWPATRAGQTVRLACPRLNWLPEAAASQPQQQESSTPKSVINSAQLLAQAVAADDSSTGTKPIKPSESKVLSIQDIGPAVPPPARFAYRRCEPTAGGTIATATNLMLGAVAATAAAASTALEAAVATATVTAGGAEWQPEANYTHCQGNETGDEKNAAAPAAEEKEAATTFDPTDKWIKLNQESDQRLFSSLVGELERMEGAIDPYSDLDLQEQWSLCIGNILRQQAAAANVSTSSLAQQSPQSDSAQNNSAPWCPLIFDGWRCWPSTRAGETAYVSCPRNKPGFSSERKAHKICTADGTWYRHPLTNRSWSNYTTCVDTVDLAFRTKILNLYVIGNLISLVALLASMIIFISFKSLNCTRVTIHKNLFLSFITNNLMWIIWYTYVVNKPEMLESNPIECQFWHILLHYFLVSNYFWMFCEGLYLHTLLVVAFVSEEKILKWFYLLGWLTPVPITVLYAYNRSHDEYYRQFCWMEESPYNLILMAPIGISLLLNLVFLINIVRVLVTKLRANNSPDTHQTRKAVRATLILIPLLGLHYILTPFRPEAKSEWESIYECIAAVCTSFQGLCVALLFCFCNGEVIAVITKKLKDTFNLKGHRHHHGDHPYNHRNSRATSTQHNGGSQTIRSLISSSSNCDLQPTTAAAVAQQRASLMSASFIAPANGNGQRSNGTASNNSNSSSMLTTVTVSPVRSLLLQPATAPAPSAGGIGVQLVPNGTDSPLTTATSFPPHQQQQPQLPPSMLLNGGGVLLIAGSAPTRDQLDREETVNLLLQQEHETNNNHHQQQQQNSHSATTSFSAATRT